MTGAPLLEEVPEAKKALPTPTRARARASYGGEIPSSKFEFADARLSLASAPEVLAQGGSKRSSTSSAASSSGSFGQLQPQPPSEAALGTSGRWRRSNGSNANSVSAATSSTRFRSPSANSREDQCSEDECGEEPEEEEHEVASLQEEDAASDLGSELSEPLDLELSDQSEQDPLDRSFGADWPLSRVEKVQHVIRLSNMELQSQEEELMFLRSKLAQRRLEAEAEFLKRQHDTIFEEESFTDKCLRQLLQEMRLIRECFAARERDEERRSRKAALSDERFTAMLAEALAEHQETQELPSRRSSRTSRSSSACASGRGRQEVASRGISSRTSSVSNKEQVAVRSSRDVKVQLRRAADEAVRRAFARAGQGGGGGSARSTLSSRSGSAPAALRPVEEKLRRKRQDLRKKTWNWKVKFSRPPPFFYRSPSGWRSPFEGTVEAPAESSLFTEWLHVMCCLRHR
eukprot:TRINITY_DN17434_c0_g1_i1.p1 TRINITY_DN17434_c0_g1~~TRINITY_DN17434_c0_g1_i1.p1  ORF type:complete len:460 (+),score=131.67 TRINITY_DN17434_c0_g1_i1:161-1540(+)